MLSTCADDARGLIVEHGLTCQRVISVDRDSVLYVNACGKARTMWLDRPAEGPLRMHMVPGFQADPPVDWHKRG